MTCAGATVNPGDLVAADADGVIVIPRRQAAAVVARARTRAAAENRAAVAIQHYAKVWDLHGAAAGYATLEVEEYDAAYDDEP